jgi:hypothetical protein
MLIIGAHRINHGGFDRGICQQIIDSRSLQGTGVYGHGAYAYYADRIPAQFRNDPFVVFQPLAIRTAIHITHIRVPGVSSGSYHVKDTFCFIVRDVSGRAVPVAILGFMNCPSFRPYEGRLYFS